MTRSSITHFKKIINTPHFVPQDIYSDILPEYDQTFDEQSTSDPPPPTGIARRPTSRPHISTDSNQHQVCPLDTDCVPYRPCPLPIPMDITAAEQHLRHYNAVLKLKPVFTSTPIHHVSAVKQDDV